MVLLYCLLSVLQNWDNLQGGVDLGMTRQAFQLKYPKAKHIKCPKFSSGNSVQFSRLDHPALFVIWGNDRITEIRVKHPAKSYDALAHLLRLRYGQPDGAHFGTSPVPGGTRITDHGETRFLDDRTIHLNWESEGDTTVVIEATGVKRKRPAPANQGP